MQVKDWNKSVYGFIGTHKRRLLNSFSSVQKTLDHSSSNQLVQLETAIRDELENLLDPEELLWKQKARCDWLQLGDRNTKFFHSRTIQRRKSNNITVLCLTDGVWYTDQDILQNAAIKYFANLYREPSEDIGTLPSNIFSRLSDTDIRTIGKPITNEEIKTVLFDMNPLKAPRSGNFQAIFFQYQ